MNAAWIHSARISIACIRSGLVVRHVSRETSGLGEHHDVAIGVFALGLRREARLEHNVVNDLALIRVHGLERDALGALVDLGYGLARDLREAVAAARTVVSDVEHQAANLAGLGLH